MYLFLFHLLSGYGLAHLALSFLLSEVSKISSPSGEAKMRLSRPLYLFALVIWYTLVPSSSQASLLGLTPNLPTIDFSGSGIIDYSPDTGIIELTGDPSSLFAVEPFIFANFMGTGVNNNKNINIKFLVDNFGNVITGDSSSPDMIILGSIDTDGDGISDHNGTLLTAEVLNFGFLNGLATTDDVFDLHLSNVNGALAYLYNDQDLGIRIISEASIEYDNAFDNSFNTFWQAQAKGVIGATAPLAFDPIPTPIPPALWLWMAAMLTLLPGVKRAN